GAVGSAAGVGGAAAGDWLGAGWLVAAAGAAPSAGWLVAAGTTAALGRVWELSGRPVSARAGAAGPVVGSVDAGAAAAPAVGAGPAAAGRAPPTLRSAPAPLVAGGADGGAGVRALGAGEPGAAAGGAGGAVAATVGWLALAAGAGVGALRPAPFSGREWSGSCLCWARPFDDALDVVATGDWTPPLGAATGDAGGAGASCAGWGAGGWVAGGAVASAWAGRAAGTPVVAVGASAPTLAPTLGTRSLGVFVGAGSAVAAAGLASIARVGVGTARATMLGTADAAGDWMGK